MSQLKYIYYIISFKPIASTSSCNAFNSAVVGSLIGRRDGPRSIPRIAPKAFFAPPPLI